MKKNKHHIDRNSKNNEVYNLISLPIKFHSGIHRYVGYGKNRKPMPRREIIEFGLNYCIENKIKINTLAWSKFMEHINHQYIGIYS